LLTQTHFIQSILHSNFFLSLLLFGHVARSGPASDTRRAIAMPTPSQWKRAPGRPQTCWLSVVSKDMKDVSIPDAMVMAEDRGPWKRVVAAHATSQEDMLLE